MNQAAVGVGSNIEPEKNIRQTKELLQKQHQLVRESSCLQTDPVGFKDQPPFLNMAFLVNTEYDFESFGLYLKELENQLGRVRTENKFGPRTIDLDIVVWNGKITDPDFFKRPFLKKNILEILPDLKF